MLPPNLMPPPAGGSNMLPSTNKLAQQMQNMKLDPLSSQNPGVANNQHARPFNQPQNVQSPQHRGHSTSVTYSGPPHATYPYNNNPTSIPDSSENQYNPCHAQPNTNNFESKISSPQSHMKNGMSNGFNNFEMQNPSQQFQNQTSHTFQQGQFQTAPQTPPTFNPQNPQYSPRSFTPSNMQNISQTPPQLSSTNQFSPMNIQASPQLPYQNNFPQQQAPRMAPPLAYPPGSPQYSGMPSSPPNSGGMWPNQQYPTAGPISPGNYPYPQQAQSVPQQQQLPKLDLDQMPSAVQYRENDERDRKGYYPTEVRDRPPPLVTTNFIAQDRGICNPRFIRSTMYCLPNQPDILKQTGIPFALTLSPFSNLSEGETAPPLCLYQEAGPLRCRRCKAYMCPFMTFVEGGRCFQCAFCKVVTEVPQEYFCFLDSMGERTDKYHRPELCLGSYEYLGTSEYCRNKQPPNPPAYIFMIEVSNASFRNGLVQLLCENMKHVLQCLKNDERNDTSKLRIGFVTYSNVLHFYNMKKNLTQPHIMVLSDVHNAFVPLLDGFLVTLSEAEALMDGLMEHIPRLFVNEPAVEVILGPVIQVGLEALKNANCSGKLLIFHSSIPNADAPGKIPHREGQKLLGTDKQKTVLTPQHDFYHKLAQECVAAGCAVDLFLFPNAYVDIATIKPICRHTGGQIYKYTYFQSHIDGDRFLEDLERNITTPTAFDAVLRLRTSAGISPIFYYGNFYMSNNTDIELSVLDGYKAITIELAYDDKLPENEKVHFQAALLYTTLTGERRIRVHNLAVVTSVSMSDVYKCCELDTIINYFAKQALKQVLEVSPVQIKNSLLNRTVRMLSCYRKNCEPSTSTAGQLLLPYALKLLPLFISCLLRSDAIAGGSEMSLDDRSFAISAVNSMDVRSSAIYFYPTLIPLHDVDVDSDLIPTPIRCTIEKLNDNGVYLLENGIYMFLWIGQAVSSDWLQAVFGVQSPNQVDKQKTTLPELNTPLSKRICNIIEDLEEGRQWCMRLRIMVQGDKLESVFRQFLVEDRGVDNSASYVEFLCHFHREILKNI